MLCRLEISVDKGAKKPMTIDERITALETRVAELEAKIAAQEVATSEQLEKIRTHQKALENMKPYSFPSVATELLLPKCQVPESGSKPHTCCI